MVRLGTGKIVLDLPVTPLTQRKRFVTTRQMLHRAAYAVFHLWPDQYPSRSKRFRSILR